MTHKPPPLLDPFCVLPYGEEMGSPYMSPYHSSSLSLQECFTSGPLMGREAPPHSPSFPCPSGVHHLMGEKGAPLPPHVPRMLQLMFPKWGEKRVPLSPPHNPLPSPYPSGVLHPKAPHGGERGSPHPSSFSPFSPLFSQVFIH